MTIRVLVVDDSRFICNRVREILEEDPEFNVVGEAHDGRAAVELAATLRPDVITMDVDMPVMDGITAVKQIMDSHPCPILMFSAMTHVGARATFDALNAGAIDFLPKQLDDIDANRETAKSQLRFRVRLVALQARRILAAGLQSSPDFGNRPVVDTVFRFSKQSPDGELAKIDLLVIAASTGGPVAIQRVLSQIPAGCKIPVLLVQHMPQNFTKSFAERLNQLCNIKVKEAEEGDVLQAGTALLGPGGMQMQFKHVGGRQQVMLRTKQAGEIYSPCADTTFTSLAEEFSGRVLVVVLTGMGSDGMEGAIRLKQRGAQVWAQDEASSTIYGMPRAIAEANIADQIYSLDEIANAFKKLS
jgi:two-component system, chemotaxis family, protein-glutamate methylesterase/glutaminase